MEEPSHEDNMRKGQKDLIDIKPPWTPEETT